jgi:predicted kinase
VDTFVQNGFNTLELISQLEEEDLNDLQIRDLQVRTKLLTAAQMLLDNGKTSVW